MEMLSFYKFTPYFENEVLRKRPYIKKQWCIDIIEHPIKIEAQEHNRYRFWGKIDELDGKILRVITLEDKQYITHFQTGDLTMKINYYPDTDSLYIEFSEKESSDSIEISEGIVLDYDQEGSLVGMDIDNAGKKVNLNELILNKLPLAPQKLSA